MPHNPKYGRVFQLCEELGYGAKSRKDPQYRSNLSTKTNRHRQLFIKQTLKDATEFPLHYEHDQVQQCVSTFLEDNSHMFLQLQRGPTTIGNTFPSDDR